MVTLNISPETRIGKIISTDKIETVLKTNNGSETIKTEILNKMLKNKEAIVTANRTLFMSHGTKLGLIPKCVIEMYDKRKDAKRLAKEAKKSLLTETDPDVIIQLEKTVGENELLDSAMKVLLNTLYGVLGSRFFPLFDLDCAEAVTLSGQQMTKESLRFANEYCRNTFGIDYDVVLFADTDSAGVNTRPFVKDVFGTLDVVWTDDNIRKITARLDEFGNLLNENCFNFIQKYFRSKMRRIEYKRENFASSAEFIAKKNYIMKIIEKEGFIKTEWKTVGLAIKKNELPTVIKDELAKIVYEAVDKNISDSIFKERLADLKMRYYSMDALTLAYNKNLTTAKADTGFLKVETHAGPHARGAVYYNQLIDHLKLGSKYEKISEGDRMRYVWIRPNNDFNLDAMGFKDVWPTEFTNLFEIDYNSMWEKQVLAPLESFAANHGWDITTEKIRAKNKYVQSDFATNLGDL